MFNRLSPLDVEKEYTPSLHIKRFQDCTNPQQRVIENFIHVGKAATAWALTNCKVRQNIRYGVINDNQLLDIFYEEQEFDSPIFVYIHGGFWSELDKSSSGIFIKTLLSQGYRVVLVDYNLCPQVTLQQLCEQMQDLFKWLKHYAQQTGAEKVTLCGHSAGAHLACQIFQTNFSPSTDQSHVIIDRMFLISGLYDLRELWSLHCCNKNNILKLDELTAQQLSPVCWCYRKDLITSYIEQNLQIHLLVGEFDSDTFKEQSRMYSKLLKSLGLKVEYQVMETYDHFNIIEEIVKSDSVISLFIKEKLGERK